jgi:hypothetical protein
MHIGRRAGRTTPTPTLTHAQYSYFPQLNSRNREFTLRDAGGIPNGSLPFSVEPAVSTLQTSVNSAKITFGLNSNRHLVRLESHVSSRKQTKQVRSNRH